MKPGVVGSCPEQTWREGTFLFQRKGGWWADQAQFLCSGRHTHRAHVCWAPVPPSGSFVSLRSPLELFLPHFMGRSSRTCHLQQVPSLVLHLVLEQSLLNDGPSSCLECLLLLGGCSWGQSWFAKMGMLQPCLGLHRWRDKSSLFMQQHNNVATWRKMV